MNNQHLIQVQRSIEQFFYKVRVNIALHNILESNEYAGFRKQMKLAIENQILYFAKIEKVNQLIGAQKIDDATRQRLLLLFPLLLQFVDEQDWRKYLQFASERGVESALSILGVERNYNLISRMGKRLDERASEAMGWVDGTTQDWILSTLEAGVSEGLSSYEIAKLLRDGARDQAMMRSEMIAEQEAAWALGETQMDVYRQAGVEKKKLITSRDESVCLICIGDEEAGEIPIGDPFPSGAMGVPIHIRCRCFVLPVLSTPLALEE